MSINLHLATVVFLFFTASQSMDMCIARRMTHKTHSRRVVKNGRVFKSGRVNHGGRDPCSVSDFKVLCRSTVKGQKNVNAATEVSIRELMKETMKAKNAAATARKSGGRVKTCYSNYDNALDNLQKALSDIKQNDGFSLNINLSASLTNIDTCNDAMGGSKKSMGFAKSSSTLHEMADNALALSTLVKH